MSGLVEKNYFVEVRALRRGEARERERGKLARG
jgi:hypothetical protein